MHIENYRRRQVTFCNRSQSIVHEQLGGMSRKLDKKTRSLEFKRQLQKKQVEESAEEKRRKGTEREGSKVGKSSTGCIEKSSRANSR